MHRELSNKLKSTVAGIVFDKPLSFFGITFMRRFIIIFCLAVGGCDSNLQNPRRTTLHLIGDSTMSVKSNLYYPERGWGMALPGFMSQDLGIVNHAANGRSTKRFVDEGRWSRALSEMKKGDYLLVQFGHNDQKRNQPTQYASAEFDYPNYLHLFIEEARKKGVTPMIASSICRRQFSELGKLRHTLNNYVSAAREVAKDANVDFFDMNQLTCDFFEQEGDAATQRYFLQIPPRLYSRYPDGKIDNTHLNTLGAALVAQFFVKDLIVQGHPLVKFINKDTL